MGGRASDAKNVACSDRSVKKVVDFGEVPINIDCSIL